MSTFVPLDQGNKSDNYKNEHSLGECLTLTDSKSFLLPYCIGSVFMLIVNTAILIIIAIQIYLRISQKNKFLHSRSLYLYYLAALSCSMYQVFLFDTGFFEVFYIQVYFQNLYFLMLLFTFGYKSLKLIQATNCQKITLQTCQIIALLFYTTMLILNLVPLTDNMQNNLPCQSPFIQSIRIFEFILGLFFLSLWKTFSDRIQGEIEANKKFLNHDGQSKKLRQKEINIKLLIKVNLASQLFLLVTNIYFMCRNYSDQQTCNYLKGDDTKYNYWNAFFSLLERCITYFFPLIAQIYVYWTPIIKKSQQQDIIENEDQKNEGFFRGLKFDSAYMSGQNKNKKGNNYKNNNNDMLDLYPSRTVTDSITPQNEPSQNSYISSRLNGGSYEMSVNTSSGDNVYNQVHRTSSSDIKASSKNKIKPQYE